MLTFLGNVIEKYVIEERGVALLLDVRGDEVPADVRLKIGDRIRVQCGGHSFETAVCAIEVQPALTVLVSTDAFALSVGKGCGVSVLTASSER